MGTKARTCSKCYKKINLFRKGFKCEADNCDYCECFKCLNKVTQCPECELYYCEKHMSNHKCEEEDMKEDNQDENEDDDDDEDNEDEDNDEEEIELKPDEYQVDVKCTNCGGSSYFILKQGELSSIELKEEKCEYCKITGNWEVE